MFHLELNDSYGLKLDIFCDSFDYYYFQDSGVQAISVVKPNTTRVYEFIGDLKVKTIFRAKTNESSLQS